MRRFFTVSYDSGHKNVRMGAGPLRLMREIGAQHEVIESGLAFTTEISTAFDLNRRLAAAIHACVAVGDFPVVLSGNCGVTNGVAAGVGMNDLAVLWFDAHGEFMTPETTVSGFLDGMPLSILTGRCFNRLATTIPSFEPIPPARIMLVGARDYSPGEREDLLEHGIALLEPANLTEPNTAGWMDRIRSVVSRLLVHVDLDVLDAGVGRANTYASAGGLSLDDILRVIELARQRFTLAALVVASYDPSCDPDGRVAAIGARIVQSTVRENRAASKF